MNLVITAIIAIIVAFLTGLGVGDLHGKGVEDAKCNAERLATATATAQELGRQLKQAEAYKKQIADAQAVWDDAEKRLASIAATPHPGVVCHSTKGGGGAVPSVPGATSGAAAGTGPLPPDVGFDPGKRLYPEVADACDAIVESYRHTLAIWSQS